MLFPPKGFRATSEECRLGSGSERFEAAAASLMTWGMPVGAHLDILQLTDADPTGYQGLLFTEFGSPIPPDAGDSETLYSAEGTQYVSAGQSIEIGGLYAPLSVTSAFRVIYVFREVRRVGYAWGTLDDAPVLGEEFFGVEWRQDDSVVALVRAVTQVSRQTRFRLVAPLIRLRLWMLRRQYVRALLPARLV